MKIISPSHEDKTEHAKLLLGLAESPDDVQTTMDGPTGLAFVVPAYLHALYEKALSFQAGEEQGDQKAEAPEKRKPGRPKKNPEVTKES